jgi:hypothetical protein
MKLLIALLLCSSVICAATQDTLRAELADQLKKRKELFDAYSASIEKKSGIFGNKTKNDLRDSQDKLKEIVDADNKIMSVLYRTVDFRNYEKLNMTYDASSYTTRIANLTSLNESLMKQNQNYMNEVQGYKSEVKKYRLYNILMIAGFIVWLGYVFWRKKKMHQ